MPDIVLPGFLIYVLIFIGKMVEVSFSTLRVVFTGKGNKLLASVCGLIEIVLWVIIASSVLTGMYEDPLKAVVYCLAFACGIAGGVAFEQKLAVGLTSIQFVSSVDGGELAAKALRASGFGVTIMEGHSVDGTKREMIFVQLKRKRIAEAVSVVKANDPCAIISAGDVKSLGGGYMR